MNETHKHLRLIYSLYRGFFLFWITLIPHVRGFFGSTKGFHVVGTARTKDTTERLLSVSQPVAMPVGFQQLGGEVMSNVMFENVVISKWVL